MYHGSKRGRGRELGVLRSALDRAAASVIAVSGPPGIGKTTLALAAAEERRHVYHRVPPLPEPQQRSALAATLAGHTPSPAHEPQEPAAGASWEELLAFFARGASAGAPAVLVLDDAHRLTESRARFLPALRAAVADAREAGRPLHVVLVSPERPELDQGTQAETGLVSLALGPLPFRAAARLLPGSTTLERLRAYAVFGGVPAVLAHLDRDASLTTNLRRVVLEPGAPLAEAPLQLVERLAQTPSRYVAILAALCSGEADWASVHAGVSDVTASGQLAPYLKRLEQMGFVEVRRSLDAGPRTRSRRYRIVDAFTAFWFRFVFPDREGLGRGGGRERVIEGVREGLERHVASILPDVWRQYMRHDALETIGSNARECGSLWGAGYDVPVAGVLGAGPAFYGRPVAHRRSGLAELAALDREVRETRYGFGRELRMRVLFTRGSPSPELAREAARRHDVTAVGAEALTG